MSLTAVPYQSNSVLQWLSGLFFVNLKLHKIELSYFTSWLWEQDKNHSHDQQSDTLGISGCVCVCVRACVRIIILWCCRERCHDMSENYWECLSDVLTYGLPIGGTKYWNLIIFILFYWLYSSCKKKMCGKKVFMCLENIYQVGKKLIIKSDCG